MDTKQGLREDLGLPPDFVTDGDKLRTGLILAQRTLQERLRTTEEYRKRKSKAVTLMQKLLIQVVSSLYLIETMIRVLFGREFASAFLKVFQQLTAREVAKVGQIAIPLPLPISMADGTGGLTVAMLLTSAPRAKVELLLPAGLELIPHAELDDLGDQVPSDSHPVMIGLGLNSDVRPVWNKLSFIKMRYLELTVGIPGVQLAKDFGEPRRPFFYIPRLLLNSVTPTLLGWAFGFKKRLRRIQADERTYVVSRLLSNQPLLKAEVKVNPKEDTRLATDVPELAPWLRFLDQPIVGRTWWGDLTFTFFHWDWFYTPTSRAEVKVQAFTDEIPLISQGAATFGALFDSPNGANMDGKAYLMSVPWRLLLPFQRDSLKGWSRFAFWRRQPPKS